MRRGLRRRDPESWRLAALRYQAVLLRVARRVLRNPEDVNEAVGETWCRALIAARRYDARRSPLPWLAGICRHTALNMARDHRRAPAVVDPRKLDRLTARRAPARVGAELSTVLHALLRTLPAPAREAVRLHFLVGVPIRELARLSGRSTAAIYQQLHRALGALRVMARARWGAEEDALLDA